MVLFRVRNCIGLHYYCQHRIPIAEVLMMTFQLIQARTAITRFNQNKRWDRLKEQNLARIKQSIAQTCQANLPYLLLNDGDSSEGPDFGSSSGAQPNSKVVKVLISPTRFMSNSFLASDLEFTLKAGIFAGAYTEDVINQADAYNYASIFVNRFMSEEGGLWHDDGGLSSAIKQSPEGKKLITQISEAFKSKMILNHGDYTKFNLKNSGISRPSFSWNSSATLKILVGGTQELTLTLSCITYDIKNCNFSATIDVEIRDDFGVTESDITDASPSAMMGVGGLMDMWVLQKNRGQMPFTSVFNFSFDCKGSY